MFDRSSIEGVVEYRVWIRRIRVARHGTLENLDGVRAQFVHALQTDDSAFFQFYDGGGGTEENGVDALRVAYDQFAASSLARSVKNRYIFMITDMKNFGHESIDPPLLKDRLSETLVTRVWFQFLNHGVDTGTGFYQSDFPEDGEKIIYGDFQP